MADIQQIAKSRGTGQYRASERHVVWWHRLDPQQAGARTGLVLAHGLLGNAFYFDDLPTSDPLYDAKAIEIAKRTCAEGMPVIATDMGGTVTWGNNLSQDAMDDTVTYFNSSVGARTDRVMLLGASMGAATVLNWARTNPGSVAAIGLLLPTLSLTDVYDNDRGGLASTIDTAYSNVTDYPSGFPGAAATVDPGFYASDFAGIPVHIWYSSDDDVAVSSVLASWGNTAGATMTNLGAIGHSISSLDIETVADWFAQYA